eukprot:352688-Chlamydomonas_euryale.AAC.3
MAVLCCGARRWRSRHSTPPRQRSRAQRSPRSGLHAVRKWCVACACGVVDRRGAAGEHAAGAERST